jgi:hypothetical protein
MVELHWIFTNGHAWFKTCDNVEHAEYHAELCGLYKNHNVDRVFIETENGQIWLKEKQGVNHANN